MSWKELGDAERMTVDSSVHDALRTLMEASETVVLDHDPDWLAVQATGRDSSVRLFVCEGARGNIVACAPILEHSSRLSFQLLGLSLCSYRVRRLSLTHDLLVDEAQASHDDVLESFLTFLRKHVEPREVLFLLGCDAKVLSHLEHSERVRSQYVLIPFGPRYRRRLIRLPATLDDYLGTLGSKTRQDLRRQERRLLKQCNDAVSCECYATADRVEEFLAAAGDISRLTYQARLHGLTLRNDERTRDRLRKAADNGWLRSYVLKCEGTPVAFMLGHLYRGTYFSADIGYDPKWSEWSVGNILHLHVIRDLVTLDPRPCFFDFMYGDNSNKERLSNADRLEGDVYVIPRSPGWIVRARTLLAFNAVTETASAWLEKYGVKTRLKRFLRRKSTAR